MTRNQLKKIRWVFAVLAVILLSAGGISAVKDYQTWKQSSGKTIPSEMDFENAKTNQTVLSAGGISGGKDDRIWKQSSGKTIPSEMDFENARTNQTDDGMIDIPKITNSDSTDQGSDTFTFSIVTLIFLIFGAINAVAAVGTSAIIYHRKASLKKLDNAKGEVRREIRQKTAADTFISTTTKMEMLPTVQQIPVCAQFNQLGRRPKQEDCCGVLPMGSETLAVVADGMGGLKNGERVSELVVHSMMEQGQRHQGSSENGILLPMLHTTSETVNRALGADVYKSGSTMLAVWVQDNGKRFQWAAVGDSRIYLYRGGGLIQLNQEHNYGQELLNLAVKGQISFEEARKSPKKGELTSFIGMGQLKYVNYSIRPIDLQAGDRILLMSDGVFNAVADQQIAQVLLQNSDVQTAANQLIHLVEQFNNPKQDNFTAIILGF